MRSRWMGCLLLAAAVACGGADDEGTGGPFPGAPGGGTTGGGATLGGSTPGGGATLGGVTPGGTTGGVTPGGTTGGVTPGGTTGAGNPGGGGTMVPCEVQKILKDKCQTCHSDPPTGAAPYALVTPAHFQIPSPIKAGEKAYQRVKARINETGQTIMPPPARPQLTAAEKSALDAWVSGGAQGVPQAACSNITPDVPTGPQPNPVDWTKDCDFTQELLAHQGQTAGDTTPYNVTKSGDSYEIFWFKPKWNEKVHAIDIQPVIDNAAMLHHWLLYMKDNASEGDGSHNPDSGLQSGDSALLSGWAPGNKSFVFPGDVGMQVIQGANARFGIELHYNTSANPPRRTDRSGAKVCVTKKLRPKEAATHWLGTQGIVGIGKFDAWGNCTVPKESHIIAMSPHMHKTGRYMKSIVTKKGGGTVTITDQAFAFDDQQIFPIDSPTGEIVVMPGDTIKTTCTFDSPGFMTFGPNTNQEMCYNFVVAYPVGSLASGTGIVGGKNTCIE